MYDGFGYLGLDVDEEIRQQLIDEEANEVIIHNEDCWTDAIGGHHDSGMGWAPDGHWCGECCKSSCKGCKVWEAKKWEIAKEIG